MNRVIGVVQVLKMVEMVRKLDVPRTTRIIRVVGVVRMAEVISVVEVAEVNKVVRVVEVIRLVEVIKVVELVRKLQGRTKGYPTSSAKLRLKFLHLGSRSEGRKARRADFPSHNKNKKNHALFIAYCKSNYIFVWVSIRKDCCCFAGWHWNLV